MQFKSSSESKKNSFGAKDEREILMIGVCGDSQKGNESEFFPACQVRGPDPAQQLLCSSVLTLLVFSCCLRLCEALVCGLLCPDFCRIFCAFLPACKLHWTQQIGLIVTNHYVKMIVVFGRKKSLDKVIQEFAFLTH